MTLAQKKCLPCEGGVEPLSKQKAAKLINALESWALSKGAQKSIYKNFKFTNFKNAMKFVNDVAVIAEKEGHHPDIYIYYNKVKLELTTHAIGGLSENDFIVAAKIDKLG